MNIMEEYADRQRPFYEWHVKNGGGSADSDAAADTEADSAEDSAE